MAVWLVRAGKHGEREAFALENNVAVVGWNDLPDVSSADTKDKLAELMKKAYPEEGKYALANFVAQIWAFRTKMEPGDLVVLPLKKVSVIAVGRVTGPYKYEPANPAEAHHTRPVKWIDKAVPREKFGIDLRHSMGAYLTVCQIERHNAERRIAAIADGGEDEQYVPTPDELDSTGRDDGAESTSGEPPLVRDFSQMREKGPTFKKVDYTLAGLLHYIDDGVIGLPDIQRPFVWSTTKVRDLFDSMYRGFPVGYLLFWDNESESGTKQIGEGSKTQKVPSRLIVDGQQRLTSLYAVFRGRAVLDTDFKYRQVEIAFRPRDGKFEVADAAIKRDHEWIPNISDICAAGSSYQVIKGFLGRLVARREVTEAEEHAISSNIDRLFDLQKYPFTALEIASSVDEEQVSDIFVRINSEGVRLNQADFILTLMSVFWDEGRAALEAFCRAARKAPDASASASPFNHFIEPDPDQLLRVAVALGFGRGRLKSVYQVLRGKDLDTGEFSPGRREVQFQVLKDAQAEVLNLTYWHQFMSSLVGAGFRSGEMISSQNALLYAYAFYLIGRKRFGLPEHRLQKLIGRWYFAATLTGRYTGSPESVMDGDLNSVLAAKDGEAFAALIEELMASQLTNDFWQLTLPANLDSSSARNPELFAYVAAQNRLNAPVLFSHKKVGDLLDPSLKTKKKALERHHLFPRAWLESQGINDLKLINQQANFALLEWPENIGISDTAPSDYVAKIRPRFSDDEWTRMHEHHALPEGWQGMPYETFLHERRKLMAAITRRGFETLR
jgi:hypothetical protein